MKLCVLEEINFIYSRISRFACIINNWKTWWFSQHWNMKMSMYHWRSSSSRHRTMATGASSPPPPTILEDDKKTGEDRKSFVVTDTTSPEEGQRSFSVPASCLTEVRVALSWLLPATPDEGKRNLPAHHVLTPARWHGYFYNTSQQGLLRRGIRLMGWMTDERRSLGKLTQLTFSVFLTKKSWIFRHSRNIFGCIFYMQLIPIPIIGLFCFCVV